MSASDLDRVRGAALDRIEKGERNLKALLGVAAVLEAAFLVGFFLLADFSNRLHLLLLISAVAVYGILAVGLFALGAHVSRCTGRVLRAIELAQEKEEGKGR